MRPHVDRAIAYRKTIETVAHYAPDDVALANPTLFAEWSGGTVAYNKDDKVRYQGLLYRCVQAHTSQADWPPTTAVSLWTRIADPAQEWPEWIQPTGGHNAYAVGTKVSHAGDAWENLLDGNVWEPGVYGWSRVVRA